MKKKTNPYYHPEENRRTTCEAAYPYREDGRKAARQPEAQVPVQSAKKPLKKRKKRRGIRRRLISLLLVVCLVFGGAYLALDRLVTGGGGSLPATVPASPTKDAVCILAAGIDYEEGRDYTDGMGMTDVILYICFDTKANTVNMLQIPRDTYVGGDVPTGNTGKINAVARFGDTDPPMAALAQLLADQFSLPVDYYVTIDMQAFRAVIDALGGIEVTVPFDITDDYGNTLYAGTQRIDGATAEFMVRQRHNYANADIGRLEMQRYMYAALLKTFQSFPMGDILKVLPAYIQYVKTDIGLVRMAALAWKVKNLSQNGITMMTLPCEPTGYNGLSVVSVHKQEAAEMLNSFFRPYQPPVSAEALGCIELAHTTQSSGTVQSMDAIAGGTAQWGKDTTEGQ